MRRPATAAAAPPRSAQAAPAASATPEAAPAGSPRRSPRKTWPSPATTGAPMTAAAASAKDRQEKTGARSLLPRLEEGEQDHVADRRRVGEQHGHPVDADALAGGGRHAVLEGPDEVL